MKAFRTGHYFLALFFTGFLTGILIVNYIWGEQLSLIGTFTEVYLMRLKNEKISFQQYIWYLIQVRGIFFLMLFFPQTAICGASLGLMLWFQTVLPVLLPFWRWESGSEKLWQRFLLWTGMSGGILLSEAVAELGMKGSILCVAGLFPQFLFMFRQFLCFCAFVGNYPQNQWNRQKRSLYAVCFNWDFSESCLNPWLIQKIVNILFLISWESVEVMQQGRQLID